MADPPTPPTTESSVNLTSSANVATTTTNGSNAGSTMKQSAADATTTTNGGSTHASTELQKQQEQVAPPQQPLPKDQGPTVVSGAPTTDENGSGQDDVEEEEDIIEDDEEDDDVEDALFTELEKEEEQEAMKHAAIQPRDYHVAPKLLKVALEKGEVKADESEEESDKEKVSSSAEKKKDSAAAVAPPADGASPEEAAGTGEEGKERPAADEPTVDEHHPASPEGKSHVHQRANQLEYLLSKASEYSNFIARDLQELQANMTEDAKKAVAKMERKEKRAEKKRKSEGKGGGGGGKKQKTSSKSASKLASAQAADDKIRAGNKPIFVQPPNLSKDCQLKDYQLEGVRWLTSLYENGVSGILADEMGLGKTIQCVALIAHLLTKSVVGPYLIVAPLATLPNWVREFEKWLPSHPVIRFHGPPDERVKMLQGPLNPKKKKAADFPFIVTSYETAIKDQSKLMKLAEFTYIIVDEGHRLKNHRCCLLSSLKKLPAANRLLLTGTPIQNTLDELWSLLNFVNPAIFDDLTVFQSWFGFRNIGQKTHGASDEQSILLEERKNNTVTKLHSILRPFLLRRVKADVLGDLPPKKEIIVYSGVSKLQAGYAEMIDNGTLRDTLINQGIEDGRMLSLQNKQMNHRKNINHPFLFGEPIDPATGRHLGTEHPQLLVRASGKFALLDRMLERLHRDGHQVLIFSQMTKVLNVIEDYLRFREWNYCRIDGSTHIDDRQSQMDQFNAERTAGVGGTQNVADDRCFVFLLSTRAGGLGINLCGGDTCIIFDSDFNPFNDNQAMDRCHRLGQTRPVAVYRLLTVNSVDIDMMERQISKKKLERMTIAGGDFRKAGRRSRGDNLSFEQLTNLLRSDIKDLNAKGGDVEDIKISDEEFEMIMNREKLFATGEATIPSEGKMYDVIDAAGGDILGAMNA